MNARRIGRWCWASVALLVLLLAVGCEKNAQAVKLPDAPQAGASAAPAVPPAPAPVAATPEAPGAAVAPPASPVATTAPAAGGEILSGATEAHRRSTITPRVGGVVAEVHVRDGQFVAKDDLLVTLDAEDFELRTRQAETALRGARTQFFATKLEWDRLKKLVDQGAAPQQQWDMLDAQFEGTKAGVSQATVAVEMGRKAIRDAVIRAPYAGLVMKRHVNEGEYAAVMPPTPLVTLEEIDTLDLRVQVPADKMDEVREGTRLDVWFASVDRRLEAKVTRVVSMVNPQTRTFSVIAELPNADRTLWSGMYAEVRLADAPVEARTGGAR